MTVPRIGPRIDNPSPFEPRDPVPLWLHGAAPGDHKTTVTLNLAYQAAVGHGIDAVILSPEATVQQLERRLDARHVLHPSFGLSEEDAVRIATAMARGTLAAADDADVARRVREDLRSGTHGRIHLADFGPDRAVSRFADIPAFLDDLSGDRQRVVFIDHLNLAGGWRALNAAVRELHAMGLRLTTMIFGTFTVNRHAMGRGQANGRYSMKDVAEVGFEVERCAHHLTTSLTTPELRERGLVRMQVLKAMMDPYGEPFDMRFVPGVGALLPLTE